jgi:hypothetical protein
MIAPRNNKVLQFIVERKITKVEKPYNDQISKKIRFTVIIESDSSNSNEEKFFEVGIVGRTSARLIIAKLKERHCLKSKGLVQARHT